MTNLQNQDENTVDFSQVGIKRKEKPISQSPFNMDYIEKNWTKMGKKNQIYALIIVAAFTATIVLLSSLLIAKIKPSSIIPPTEYVPPEGYHLMPGEEYTPPFP